MKDSELIMPCLQQIVNFFSSDKIEQIAKETSFVKRKRKLSPLVFLGLFTFGLIQKADATLVQLVSIAKRIAPSFFISPQGLHKRINKRAVEFLKRLFALSLQLRVDADQTLVPMFEPFGKVHLLDSSYIALPKEVEQRFAASGGSNQKAGAKIQLMVDYKTGNFSHLWLTDAISPDQKQIPTAIKQIESGDLILFDLGYFSQETLKTVADLDAFFLCLLKTQTNLYLKKDAREIPIDLIEFLNSQPTEIITEVSIFVGKKAKTPCRLIIQPLSSDAVNRRRRRVKATAKRKGRTVSHRQLSLCNWGLYLTNVCANVFATCVVPTVYSLRWQIELVFKGIKSHLGFECILGKREARVECQLYGRLIGMVLSLCLTGQFRQQLWESEGRQLSLLKSFAHLPLVAPMILKDLLKPQLLLSTLVEIAEEMMTLCRMDKRRKRFSTAELLRAATTEGANG